MEQQHYTYFSSVKEKESENLKNQAEIENQICEIIEKKGLDPLETQFIANKLQLSWATANRILLSMSLKGELTALKTSKAFVFLPPCTITLKK